MQQVFLFAPKEKISKVGRKNTQKTKGLQQQSQRSRGRIKKEGFSGAKNK